MKHLTITLALLSAAASASANNPIRYINGPITATGGNSIGTVSSVFDSFTLTNNATLRNITAGIWTQTGYSLTSLDWAITTGYISGTTLASGTVSSFSTSLFAANVLGAYTVNSDNFAITPTDLPAGDYWLELSNAQGFNGVSTSGTVYWDANGGPSTAYDNDDGITTSESFTIHGTPTPTPEPGTLALCGLGLAGGWIARRRRQS